MQPHRVRDAIPVFVLLASCLAACERQAPPPSTLAVKIATQENQGLMSRDPSVRPQIERSLIEDYFVPEYKKKTGVKLDVSWVFYGNSSEILDAVRSGEADIGLGGVSKTKARESAGHRFVASYMHVPMVFVGSADQGLKPGELGECTGIVLEGTSYVPVAAGQTDKVEQVGPGESIPRLMQAIESGQGCAFAVMDSTVAYLAMLEGRGFGLSVFGISSASWYAVVVRDGHLESLVAELDRYVEQEKRQPVLHSLIAQQFSEYASALLNWGS